MRKEYSMQKYKNQNNSYKKLEKEKFLENNLLFHQENFMFKIKLKKINKNKKLYKQMELK